MNALLASIFSPLKEPVRSPTRQLPNGNSRLHDHGALGPRKRHHGGVAKRPAKRKAVAFDMTVRKFAHDYAEANALTLMIRLQPKKDVLHTPPKQRQSATPQSMQKRDDEAHDENETETKQVRLTTSSDDNNEEYAFKRLVNHRWKDDALELEVEWEKGDRTWEPEARLHEDVPDALLAYWESQEGRPENPSRPGFYEIHAIRKHSRDRKRLFVEWVGYGAQDATWEPRRVVEDAALWKASDYWGSLPRPKRRRRPRI